MPDQRIRYVSAVVQALLIGALSYYGIKWIMEAFDPTRKSRLAAQKQAEKLLKKIGVKGVKLSEYELAIAADLVDPLSIPVEWTQIGGLQDTIQEVKETVILPIKQRAIFEGSQLLAPPKGVLLYGPPGCGKTMIAKATAKEAGCRFLNLQVSSLTDKWYGESQKLAAAVFSLAIKLQPCIIFIDEIDSFLRARDKNDHEATAMMKAQFMSLWDGLLTDRDCQVIVMGATNRPQDVDKAILRRMPASFHVGLPNEKQREDILRIILGCENVDDEVFLNLDELASITNGFSGSDLREVCRVAAMSCVRDYLRERQSEPEDDGNETLVPATLRSINLNDLRKSAVQYSSSVSIKA